MIYKIKYDISKFVFTFANTMTMLHAQSVQEALCYDNLIKRIASHFENNRNFNLHWDNVKRYFKVSWTQFCYDVIMEINSRVFAIKQGVLLTVTFTYENREFGYRCLIPLRRNITL